MIHRFFDRIICHPRTSQLGFLALLCILGVSYLPRLNDGVKALIIAILAETARRAFKARDPQPPTPPTP